ncbi:MAG TPA: serine/threonine-protein kinase [Gemmatimonadaceae bacterium]|nr:serine/threonine-protein kinase [Gemmatimonadaceae bacterium]
MDESQITQSDAELRSHVERVLAPTYELEKEIGRGGMGIVFLARDARLKRRVAIKLLPPELSFRSEIRSRFLREAETAAQLSHPSIVPIYSVDERQGLVYFVMAFVDGENLAKRIHDRGALEPVEARRILREVADALAYAHDRGVVHRDIKPDNILIDSQSGRPMVTDFGIARAVTEGGEARLTATGIAIGTPAFMSPEQSAGDRELDGRSDLYSLGVVAYQMLCGDLPFVANNTPALLVKHLSEAPVPIDRRSGNVPADLARAVMICLEKTPHDRFASAHALVDALDTGAVPPVPAMRNTGRNTIPAPAALADAGAGLPAAPARTGARAAALHTERARVAAGDDEAYVTVTAAEEARWLDPAVDRFRRSVMPFMYVTGFFFLMRLLGGPNLLFVSAFWGIGIAYRYARLWSDGYDWHDVFRVPRERLLWDAVTEWFEHNVQSIWSKEKRIEARARRRRELTGGATDAGRGRLPERIGAADAAALGSGPHAALARQALVDRDEIRRLVLSLPASEQRRVSDVPATANKLADSVMAIAVRLAEIERAGSGAQAATAIDVEIKVLESQANPLDRAASESRVRRLATLRRQRRSIAELDRKREELQGKLDNCILLLQNMKFDVLRLKTGDESWQHVTTIAEQAMAVAREVDSAVYVADELRRVAPRGGSAGRTSDAPLRR